MTEFDKSNWAKTEFSRGYVDNADVFIVERRRMIGILVSFYSHFLKERENCILDLGCGDGLITHELLKADPSLSATLVDGSLDMLEKAKGRLAGLTNVEFIRASFQELLDQTLLAGSFDFVFSSLAIHHLSMKDKIALFNKVYAHLNADGYFVNIDVILAPSCTLEQWYLSLWKDWIDERKRSLGITGNQYDGIIQQYKDNKDNKPDTLDSQLDALQRARFHDVDCYYKYGIFTMFGGRK